MKSEMKTVTVELVFFRCDCCAGGVGGAWVEQEGEDDVDARVQASMEWMFDERVRDVTSLPHYECTSVDLTPDDARHLRANGEGNMDSLERALKDIGLRLTDDGEIVGATATFRAAVMTYEDGCANAGEREAMTNLEDPELNRVQVKAAFFEMCELLELEECVVIEFTMPATEFAALKSAAGFRSGRWGGGLLARDLENAFVEVLAKATSASPYEVRPIAEDLVEGEEDWEGAVRRARASASTRASTLTTDGEIEVAK